MNPLRRIQLPLIVGLCLLAGSVHAHGPLHGEIEEISARLSRTSDPSELLLRRADLYRLDGNPDAALADLATAARIVPVPDGVEWIRSRVLMDLGRPADAIPHLNRWLELHPSHESGLALRAQAHELSHDPESAIRDYTVAITAAAQPSVDLYLARARAQRQLGSDRWPEALRGLDDGMSRLGILVTLQLEAISLEESLGRIDAALSRLDTLNQLSSRHERWLVRKAELLARAGRPGEARRSWKAALEACQALPERLRTMPATRELELSIRRNLSEDELPAATQTAVVRSSPNPGIRLLPEGTKLTP